MIKYILFYKKGADIFMPKENLKEKKKLLREELGREIEVDITVDIFSSLFTDTDINVLH